MPISPRKLRAQSQAPPKPEHHKLYTRAWRTARLAFLAAHPVCVICETSGLIVPASEVDHRIPHRGRYDLFWDADNWQALCSPCHAAKSAKERATDPHPG